MMSGPVLCGLASCYLTWSTQAGSSQKFHCLLAGCCTALAGWRLGLAGGLAGLVAVWSYNNYSLANSRARLIHVASGAVKDPVRRRLAETVERIVETTESLARPCYVPTLWAAGSWANLALLVVKQKWDKRLRSGGFTRDLIVLPDGGTVSVDWPPAGETDHLPADAPLVVYLHTITGSSKDTGHYMRAATRRGWRSCVLNRRGHNMLLTSARFNVIGDAEDTRVMVEHVMAKYPQADYLGMVGISAGSGLLVTYLGKEGDRTPVQAACSLCPAYDISQAFDRLRELFPAVDSYILQSMKKRFLNNNTEILEASFPAALAQCQQAQTIVQFMEAHVTFAGSSSVTEYYEDSNPMAWVGSIVRPLLIINSEDDMVCLPENIREDVVLDHGGALLLRTKKGAHIAFNEGALGQGNYLSRVSLDFLESARNLHNNKND